MAPLTKPPSITSARTAPAADETVQKAQSDANALSDADAEKATIFSTAYAQLHRRGISRTQRDARQRQRPWSPRPNTLLEVGRPLGIVPSIRP